MSFAAENLTQDGESLPIDQDHGNYLLNAQQERFMRKRPS
jgi:hypothetical protein